MYKYFKWVLPILVLMFPALAMEEVELEEIKPRPKPTPAKFDPDALVLNELQTTGFNTRSGKYFTQLLKRQGKKKIQISWLNKKGHIPHLYLPPIGVYSIGEKEVDNYNEVVKFVELLEIDRNKGIQLTITFVDKARTSLKELWDVLDSKMPKKLGLLNLVDRRKAFDFNCYNGLFSIGRDCPDVTITLSTGGTKSIASLYGLFTNPVGFEAKMDDEPMPRVVIVESKPKDFYGKTMFSGRFYNPKEDLADFWDVLGKRDWSNVHELMLTDANLKLVPDSYKPLAGIFTDIKRLAIGGVKSTPKDVMELLSAWGARGRRFDFYYVKFNGHLSNKNKEEKHTINFGVNTEDMLQLPEISPENMDAIERAVAIANPAKLDGVVMPFVNLGEDPSGLMKRLISFFEFGWEDICELAITAKGMNFDTAFLPINQTVFPNVNRLRIAGSRIDMNAMMAYISKFKELILFESLANHGCLDHQKLPTAYSLLFKIHSSLRWVTTSEDLTHPYVLMQATFKELIEYAGNCKDFRVLEMANFDMYDEAKPLLQAWPELSHIKVNNFIAVLDKGDDGSQMVEFLAGVKKLQRFGYDRIIFKEYGKFDGGQNPETRTVENALRAKKMEDFVKQQLKLRNADNASGKLEVLEYTEFNAQKPALRRELLGNSGLKATKQVETVKSNYKGIKNPKQHKRNPDSAG